MRTPDERREVASDPLGDWYLALPSKLEPKQVESILRQALAGNIWQQTQLTNRMLESWPMFKKCAMEVRDAVANAKYVVHPFALPGKRPTARAQEKADLVTRAISGFDTDRFADEDGFRGMVYDLTDSVLNGVALCELMWNRESPDGQGGAEIRPRASAYVSPRHYCPQPDGSIGIGDSGEEGSWLSFPTQPKRQPKPLNPHKFLAAKFKSKSGSFLGAGLMRTLAYYWTTVVYGRDFMFSFAQKHGNPFLSIPYESGIPETEVARFEQVARRAAAQGWCVHPNTGKIEVTPAQAMSGDNAQLVLMRMADEACQMLMLGQTLTSSAPANGGTRAQGVVHEGVRQDRLEALTDWMGELLTEQFAESVVWANYRETSERPTIVADMEQPLTPEQRVAFLAGVSNSRVPLPVEPVYKKLNFPVPQPGEEVVQNGEIKVLGEAMTDDEKFERQLGQQVEQAQVAVQFQSEQVQAVEVRHRRAVARATDSELDELEELAGRAERAPHVNGEAAAVKAKLAEIERSSRL